MLNSSIGFKCWIQMFNSNVGFKCKTQMLKSCMFWSHLLIILILFYYYILPAAIKAHLLKMGKILSNFYYPIVNTVHYLYSWGQQCDGQKEKKQKYLKLIKRQKIILNDPFMIRKMCWLFLVLADRASHSTKWNSFHWLQNK